MNRFVCCALGLLFLASITLAQSPATTSVPNLVRYGGVLKDAHGVPVEGTVGVAFAIYKEQDGGAAVWIETQNVTPDANGDYSVLLGSTTASGLPGDLFQEQEQRWLGVQVQGQPEQPRVLLVSVPYAFHAGEAEKLSGHSASEFVTTNNLETMVQQQLQSGPGTISKKTSASTRLAADGKLVPLDGASDFIATTSDQVVLVQQNGSGFGVAATAPSKSAVVGITGSGGPSSALAGVQGISSASSGYGVYGLATSTSSSHPGIGIYGQSNSPNGTGLRAFALGTGGTIGFGGGASSTSGVAVDATESATSGNTFGMVARIYSPTGTGAYILNNASGNVTGSLIKAQTNAGVQFSVDGQGNVNSASGAYRIGGSGVVSIGRAGDLNLFLGVGAGANNVAVQGVRNVFSGYQAGYSNTIGLDNVFAGYQAGYSNIAGFHNLFAGYQAGYSNTSGYKNVFFGLSAGYNNTTGNSDIYVGNQGPASGSESNTIRIGTQGNGSSQQNAAYMAGIYGNAPSGSPLLVVVNPTGQLGTSTAVAGVSSFNSRSGAVVPAQGDYSFSLLSGTLAGSQFSGTYNGAVTLSNTSNVYYGNSFNSVTNYQIDGSPVVSIGNAGDQNIFLGVGAGLNNVAGQGVYNVFAGASAGYSNTVSYGNVFSGYQAGYSNTSGSNNVFSGNTAGYSNTTSSNNVFTGAGAGYSNTSGYGNVFSGYLAGYYNTTGYENIFSGFEAGGGNTTGSGNIFFGLAAGYSNTTGHDNVFFGVNAGLINTTGYYNVFSGFLAGRMNNGGNGNTYIGYAAGETSMDGNNNVYLGNPGCPNPCGESNTIRIGGDDGLGYGSQTATFIAGIYGVNVGGVPVQINSDGQLGAATSSLRFKEQVRDMGDGTSALMKLRPVTFLYKPEFAEGDRVLQYGLIAEEVAEVYPELVAYDKDGQPYTVRYQYLSTMLLNEVQKQYRRAEEQSQIVVTQQAQIKTQQKEIESLKQQLQVQSASVQERLSRLEEVVRGQVQTVAENKR